MGALFFLGQQWELTAVVVDLLSISAVCCLLVLRLAARLVQGQQQLAWRASLTCVAGGHRQPPSPPSQVTSCKVSRWIDARSSLSRAKGIERGSGRCVASRCEGASRDAVQREGGEPREGPACSIQFRHATRGRTAHPLCARRLQQFFPRGGGPNHDIISPF
jgi:hypothetical protein